MSHHRALSIGLSLVAAGVMLTSAAVPAAVAEHGRPAAAAKSVGSLTTTITGSVGGVAQSGTFTIHRFVRQSSGIAAVGDLTLGGTNFGTAAVPVTVTDPPGSCQILHLDLGPLDLNLLGLHIHLNEVVLDITAQQGPGNLLCAVANLLDNSNALSGITALLNNILRVLSI
jgi:hypothetical protein